MLSAPRSLVQFLEMHIYISPILYAHGGEMKDARRRDGDAPASSALLQVLFLNEVEEILEMIQGDEFSQVMKPLFGQVARCIGSPHFQAQLRLCTYDLGALCI